MRMRPPRPAARGRLALLAAALAVVAAAAGASAAAAANVPSSSSSSPDTIFSLKPDYMRVLKRRTTVYMPGERGGAGKWARQFPGGDAERREAEQAAKAVAELLAADAALWAGLPPSVVAEAAPAAAAGGNATAPAPKARRSQLRKLLAEAAAGGAVAPAAANNNGTDAAFDSFLQKIGAASYAAPAAAAADAAAPAAAAAANAAKPAANAAAAAAATNKPAATNAAAKPAAKPAANAAVVPINAGAEPAIDAAAAETDAATAKAAVVAAAADADAVEAAATQAVEAEADKAAANKAVAEQKKQAAEAEAKKPQAEQEQKKNSSSNKAAAANAAPAAAPSKDAADDKKNAAAPALAAEQKEEKAEAQEEDDEELAPKIGGLYTGPNIVGGFAVGQSWGALDAYEASNAKGAQGTADPPSPAIAVGHGQVLEAAGWSLRAYSALDGTPITAPTSLSSLFDVPSPVVVPAGGNGNGSAASSSLIGRAALHFDAHGTGRFFVAAHVQDVGGNDSGDEQSARSRIVVAVSAGPNIVGSWYIYDLDVGFAGRDGLPARDACTGGGGGGKAQAQCWAAEPAIGNDGQGLYLTFDNYRRDLESGYTHIGANVVAIDKFALASSFRDAAAAEWWLDSSPADDGRPALGIAPGLPAPFVHTKGMPAQFLSAPYGAAMSGAAPLSYLVHYGLNGTKEMRGAAAGGKKGLRALASGLRLEVRRVPVAAPAPLAASGPAVAQPAQGAPALLLSSTNGVTAASLEPADFPLGRSVGAQGPAPLALPAAARLGNLRLAADRLYTVAPVRLPDGRVAAWWLEIDRPSLAARRSGVVAYEKGSLLGPSIAVNKAGRAAVATTAVGAEVFPSAAVATLEFGEEDDDGLPADAWAGARLAAGVAAPALPTVPHTLRLPGAGAGFADGKGVYAPAASASASAGGKAPRALHGGAAAGASASAVGVDGTLWSASEAVLQSCSLAEFKSDATCGRMRTAASNWGTRVTQVEVDEDSV